MMKLKDNFKCNLIEEMQIILLMDL